MKPPCEVISKYVLPAARALIARKLIEKYDYTQVDAAAKLGMTQSAMSRYLGLERGRKIEVVREISKLTDDIARSISRDELSPEEMLKKMCDICVAFRKSGGLCGLHRDLVPTLSKKCDICFESFKKTMLHPT